MKKLLAIVLLFVNIYSQELPDGPDIIEPEIPGN